MKNDFELQNLTQTEQSNRSQFAYSLHGTVLTQPLSADMDIGLSFKATLVPLSGPSADDENASHVAMTTDSFDWQIQGSFWNF